MNITEKKLERDPKQKSSSYVYVNNVTAGLINYYYLV